MGPREALLQILESTGIHQQSFGSQAQRHFDGSSSVATIKSSVNCSPYQNDSILTYLFFRSHTVK